MVDGWSGWMPEPTLLKDRAAVVAGGGAGIGAATTRILAGAGATVAVVDNDRERADEITAEVAASGGSAVTVEADLRDEGSCGEAVGRAVAELGGIDILANVAGGMHKHAQWQRMREWTTEAWDNIVHLNLRYVFWSCRAALPAMEARGGGTIVNVTSIAGLFGAPDQSAYGAAKAGLINLTKTLAVECGPSGIRVNAVSPGVTLTPAAQAAMPDDRRQRLSAITPLGELARPEDIARAIFFFASPLSERITGQMLVVDGGVGVNFPYPSLHS
jgi:NAD(P)-dependent dehydrogenase (short-subunit alcohol dehydrogenase family)